MKNVITILIAVVLFTSCGEKVSREQAIALQDNVRRINDIHQEIGQSFINESKDIVLELNSNPECYIDFEHIQSLLNSTLTTIKRAKKEIAKVPEIDEKIGFRNSYATLVDTELEVYQEFEIYYNTLKVTRDSDKIEEISDKVFDKLSKMKQDQDTFNKAQEDFSEKYEL